MGYKELVTGWPSKPFGISLSGGRLVEVSSSELRPGYFLASSQIADCQLHEPPTSFSLIYVLITRASCTVEIGILSDSHTAIPICKRVIRVIFTFEDAAILFLRIELNRIVLIVNKARRHLTKSMLKMLILLID